MTVKSPNGVLWYKYTAREWGPVQELTCATPCCYGSADAIIGIVGW